MNLNDPFNRLSRQQQSEYNEFRETLKNSEIDNLASAQNLLKDMKQRAWKFTAAIALVVLIISLFFPQSSIVTMILGLVIALWLITSSFKAQRYLKRFIQEELVENK